MILNLNTITNYSVRVLKRLVPNLVGFLRVKAGRPLVGHLLKMVYFVRGRLEPSYVRIIVSFVRDLVKLNKKSGPRFVVKYLKSCSALLIQAVAEGPVPAPQKLGAAVARTKSGLPRLIPRVHRAMIRSGSTFHVRFWLTMFSLYRPIEFVGKFSLQTIITPGPVISNGLRVEFCESFSEFLKNYRIKTARMPQVEEESGSIPFWIDSFSPNSTRIEEKGNKCVSTHLHSLISSIFALGRNPKPWLKAFDAVCEHSGQSSLGLLALSSRLLWGRSSVTFTAVDQFIGKLGLKVEPAGKIRVFAMVDPFTQWALKPLHTAIQRILKQIPTDATFNQLGRVEAFNTYLLEHKITEVYSYDLTAATDRLPVQLQEIIVALLFGENFAQAWRTILTDRWYALPGLGPVTNHRNIEYHGITPGDSNPNVQLSSNLKKVMAVKYAQGQPMGALSSWVMLALTHHVVVATAARRVSSAVFSNYLVLGDDIVIADKNVAREYLEIIKELGCPINIHKSIISNNGSFEFAKRFIMAGVDVSPVSWKEMFVSAVDSRALMALVAKLKKVVPRLRMSSVAAALGYGHKALARIMGSFTRISMGLRRLTIMMTLPGQGPFATLISQTQWILSDRPNHYAGHKPKEGLAEWARGLVDTYIDSIPQPTVPRERDEFLKQVEKLFVPDYSGIGVHWRAGNVPTFHFLGETLANCLMTLYNDLWNKYDDSLIGAKEVFDSGEMDEAEEAFEMNPVEMLDKLFELKQRAEKDSVISSSDQDVPKVIDNVVTLNRNPILRIADHVRQGFSRLSIQLDSTLRKGQVRKISNDDIH